MGIFKRKNGADAISTIEGEIEAMRARRTKLHAQLATAEAELERAIADRRRHLVEEDVDGDANHHPRDVVGHARDHRDGLIDAIAELDQRIAAVETKLVEARDRLAREAAAKELNALAEALDATVERFREAADGMTAAVVPIAHLVPHSSPTLAARLTELTRDAAAAVGELLVMARTHAEQVIAGTGTIRHPPAPAAPAPAVPPDVPRRVIFVRANSSWQEPDGTIATAGIHSTPSVPVKIAEQALRNNTALVPGSEIAQKLLQIEGPDWGKPHPNDCVDLATGLRPEKLPERNSAPVVHSGAAVTGTARVLAAR